MYFAIIDPIENTDREEYMGIYIYGVKKSNPINATELDDPIYELKFICRRSAEHTTTSQTRINRYATQWQEENPKYVIMEDARKIGAVVYQVNEKSPLLKGFSDDYDFGITPVGYLAKKGRSWSVCKSIIDSLGVDTSKIYKRHNPKKYVGYLDSDKVLAKQKTELYSDMNTNYEIIGEGSEPQYVKVVANKEVAMEMSIFDLIKEEVAA